MYLVSEEEFKQVKKRKPSKQPQDVQLVTNSLKAVTQQRKKEAISQALPRIHMRKYTVQGGLTPMTDKDVAKPLQPAAAATAAPRRRQRVHVPIHTPRIVRATALRAIRHSTPRHAQDRTPVVHTPRYAHPPQHSSLYGTPIAANLSTIRRYRV